MFHRTLGLRRTEIRTSGGKRLILAKGAVRGVIAKQPKEQPMIIETPHAEAKVVGTTLKLVVDPAFLKNLHFSW